MAEAPSLRQSFKPHLPAFVVCRQAHARFDGDGHRLPIDRVPLEQRTGTMTIILAFGSLTIEGKGREGIYPKGALLEYTLGCEVFLEVLPRGLTDQQHAQRQRNMPMDTVRLPGSRTPLFVSKEASLRKNLAHRGETDLEEVRLLPKGTLAPYLESALPLLGASPADIWPAIRHIRRALARGRDQIQVLRGR